MDTFFKKHSARLKTAALILMLMIPIFLQSAASINSIFLVNFFLVLMGGVMLFVMIKG